MKLATVFALTTAAALAGATVGFAQQDPIAARMALMKRNNDQAKIAVGMMRGQIPFDVAKAKAVFADFEDAAEKMPNLFPPNSKTGEKTRASPKIWENMADLKAQFAKFGADAKTAQASVKDLDGLKAAINTLGKDCDNCHESYRLSQR